MPPVPGEVRSAHLAFEYCDLGSMAVAVGLTWLGGDRMGGRTGRVWMKN